MTPDERIVTLRALMARTNSDYPLPRDECDWLLDQWAALRAVAEAAGDIAPPTTWSG